MELDKRIKEGKRPLTCFDTEQAMQFIGKQCYFSDDATDFMDLDKADGDSMFYVAELQNIWTAEEYCFADNSNDWCFILPCEWVEEEKKEPEKKYRPYSLNEFLNEHEIGDKITYRHKYKEQPENFIRHKEMICGYQIMEGKANTPGEGLINLGGIWVSLQVMFDDYETPNSYLYPEVWEPFGVLDKENE